MAGVPEAIGQLKTAFLAITVPAGFTLGNRVYAWPADRDLLNRELFPFIVVGRELNIPGRWEPVAQDFRNHIWPAGVLIALAPLSTRDDISGESEAISAAWELAGARALFNSEGMEGGPLRLGSSSRQFTSETGNFSWMSAQAEFWGVYFRIIVTQTHGLSDDEECD